jgi:hypothetical protein
MSLLFRRANEQPEGMDGGAILLFSVPGDLTL